MSVSAKRIARLELASRWGSSEELERCDVVIMRIPEGADGDPRVVAARSKYETRERSFIAVSLASAEELPLWRAVSLDRVSDQLLVDLRSWIEAKLGMEQVDA